MAFSDNRKVIWQTACCRTAAVRLTPIAITTHHPIFIRNSMLALIRKALIATIFAISLPVSAQTDHSQHGTTAAKPAAAAATTSGEGLVKKVDKSKGTVTLAHGPMNGMPAMTMTYKVKTASWLDKLRAGQKIRFTTDPADGGMTVASFEPLK
jgi:Cu(I)/Ag(I) efflux system protein CusF